MKVVIDEQGFLGIERAKGRVEPGFCPKGPANQGHDKKCGDWCALFGEPNGGVLQSAVAGSQLELCEGRVLRGAITDLRKAKTVNGGGA